MFFKLNSFYRQFSHFSLRLFGKKLLTSSSNSFPLSSLTNSPLRGGRTNKIRKPFLMFKGCPTPFGIVPIKKKDFYNKLVGKSKEKLDNNLNENVHHNEPEIISHSNSNSNSHRNHIDLMFPLLTGEELKAFDSSVFE